MLMKYCSQPSLLMHDVDVQACCPSPIRSQPPIRIVSPLRPPILGHYTLPVTSVDPSPYRPPSDRGECRVVDASTF